MDFAGSQENTYQGSGGTNRKVHESTTNFTYFGFFLGNFEIGNCQLWQVN